MSPGGHSPVASTLIRRLFVPDERWGWEFTEPAPPRPAPAHEHRPTWREPPAPDVSQLLARRSHRLASIPKLLLFPAGFVVLGLVNRADGGGFLVWVGVALAVALPVPALVVQARLRRIRRSAAAERAELLVDHERALAAWESQVATHDVAEHHRWTSAPLYAPVLPRADRGRVDVFGGTGDGWASLLATSGASILSAGTGIALIDLSERGVGGGLGLLAERAGCPVEVRELPRELERIAPLAAVGPDEAAELLADAFTVVRGGEDGQVLRGLDAELLATVGFALHDPLSVRRLAAGLRVLEGLDGGSRVMPGSAVLSADEVDALVDRMDSFGRGERTAEELRFLRSSLETLAGVDHHPPARRGIGEPDRTGRGTDPAGRAYDEPEGAAGEGAGDGSAVDPADWWPVRGLRILATSSRSSSPRRKELADHLLAQVALHQLRRRPAGLAQPDMLVVAGADHLGRATLDGLARHAEIAGVRLTLLFERLADDAERMIGRGGSATIIMRLGSATEAGHAADFIGRGYRFVLSQVTAQVGRSFTAGDSDSVGSSDSESVTTGTSGGRGRTLDGGVLPLRILNTSTNSGWQESVATSRADTWQRTTNFSVADSTNDGTTSQRVYEYTVEPTTVQTLPTTAFLLVNPIGGGQRVISGDCNPGTVLLDRVADPSDRPVLADDGGFAVARRLSAPPELSAPPPDRQYRVPIEGPGISIPYPPPPRPSSAPARIGPPAGRARPGTPYAAPPPQPPPPGPGQADATQPWVPSVQPYREPDPDP